MFTHTQIVIRVFAEDAKLFRKIESKEDCEHLQKDLDKIYIWSKPWKMESNAKKCKVLEMGNRRMRKRGNYSIGNEWINKTNVKKDLGVWITDNLLSEKHINKITGDTYQLLRNIIMAFNYLDEEMIRGENNN